MSNTLQNTANKRMVQGMMGQSGLPPGAQNMLKVMAALDPNAAMKAGVGVATKRSTALQEYMDAHGGQMPTSPEAFAEFYRSLHPWESTQTKETAKLEARIKELQAIIDRVGK